MRKYWKIMVISGMILLFFFFLEESLPYEVLHSSVMTTTDLTENRITLVVHSLLPIDRDQLARETVEDHQRLNGRRPNPYFELELYRTRLHYRLGIVYDTILCNGSGQIIPETE